LEDACVVLYSNVFKAGKSCKLRLNIVVPKLHNSDPLDPNGALRLARAPEKQNFFYPWRRYACG
jgi:hypothetical protein